VGVKRPGHDTRRMDARLHGHDRHHTSDFARAGPTWGQASHPAPSRGQALGGYSPPPSRGQALRGYDRIGGGDDQGFVPIAWEKLYWLAARPCTILPILIGEADARTTTDDGGIPGDGAAGHTGLRAAF